MGKISIMILSYFIQASIMPWVKVIKNEIKTKYKHQKSKEEINKNIVTKLYTPKELEDPGYILSVVKYNN